VLARILALKQDAGSGALEQMVLAEFCKQHFAEHVPKLSKVLAAKLQTLREALAEQFGTTAEFGDPAGGIYLWIKLPDNVDTQKLAQAALAAGVSLNPGPEWSTKQGLRPLPAAPLLRQSRSRDHQAGRRGAGRSLPPRVRGAAAQRQPRSRLIRAPLQASGVGPVFMRALPAAVSHRQSRHAIALDQTETTQPDLHFWRRATLQHAAIDTSQRCETLRWSVIGLSCRGSIGSIGLPG